MLSQRRPTPNFVRTGQCIEQGVERLEELYRMARELCPDEFIGEETRQFDVLNDHVSVGFLGSLRKEISHKLDLAPEIFSLDRFSIHGCGPVGLHDDFFRFPYVYFVIVVAHSGQLGLIDEDSRARLHEVGEIILLDPRRKHGLVQQGTTAEEHIYESTHSPVHDEDRQFMFLDFDVRRPDLRRRFRGA
jgi:hypothetical protein